MIEMMSVCYAIDGVSQPPAEYADHAEARKFARAMAREYGSACVTWGLVNVAGVPRHADVYTGRDLGRAHFRDWREM